MQQLERTWEVRPVLYAWTMAVVPHPVQAGGRTEKIITIIDDRNDCDSRLLCR